MRILDFYPTKGSYHFDETVQLSIELDQIFSGSARLRVDFFHLGESPVEKYFSTDQYVGSRTIQVEWLPPAIPTGYGVRVQLLHQDGWLLAEASTAFDVLACWTDFPRYGFICDFGTDRPDPKTTLQALNRFHINGLQFYDWQFRHDTLVAPTEEYTDPLGRSMSLEVIHKLVDEAHQHGVAALAYLAVYAASVEFRRFHPDWALFDESGSPISFGDGFLGLMDPSADSPWSRHLLQEAGKALKEMPFDGLHIDQYGNPKEAWNAQHQAVDLSESFVQFVRATREQNPGKAILFNAVGNWPIEALATAPLDFLYIEVWPPEVEYRQLARIVLEAVQLSKGKPVVIALYLPAEQITNILIVNAILLACGGTRIELGENTRLLADPYFPKHQAITEELRRELRRFYDYAVRNGEWLYSYSLPEEQRKTWAKAEFNSRRVTLNETVWCVLRQRPDGLSITLINLNGIENPCWDSPQPAPIPLTELPILVECAKEPHQVWWTCPEQEFSPQALDFSYQNRKLHITIPKFRYTGVIFIHD
jgi:dextranase